MTDDLLFYKGKKVTGDALEITFHKDYTYHYNDIELPVACYKLTKCKQLEKVDFDQIDYHNDGVTIDIKKDGSRTTFTTTDMGGITVTIECETVDCENREYETKDLVEIIKNLQRQADDFHEREKKYYTQKEEIKSYLTKEIDTTTIKLSQADWLTEPKKQFLNGHLITLRRVLELIESLEK